MTPRARCPECHAALGPGTPTACPACFAALDPPPAPPAPKRVTAVRDDGDEDDGIPMATIKGETPDEDVPFELAANPDEKPDRKPVRSRVKAAVDGTRSKAKARAKGKGKRPRSDDPEPSPGQMRKVVGVLAGVAAFAVAFFGVQYLFFGGGRGPDAGDGRDGGIAAGSSAESVNAAAGAGAATPGGFVVFDTPGPPADQAAKKAADPAPPRKPPAVAPLAAEKPPEPVEGWAVKPDPPAGPPADLPADATVPNRPLVFAAGNGPFVAVMDAEPPAPPGPDGTPTPFRSTVFDLRTGKPAGTFKVSGGWLGPDGRWLLGRAVPAAAGSAESVLPSYQVDKLDKPAAELRLPGQIQWLDFVAADRVAVLTFDPKPVVCVYTLADGKRVQTIRPTSDMLPPVTNDGGWQPLPTRLLGAVSPGGRYVVVGGAKALAVLDLTAGEQVAELPCGPAQKLDDHRGINFHPNGTELYAVTRAGGMPGVPVRLRGWSLATGRPTFDVRSIEPRVAGPPLPGPVPGTLILPDFPGYVVDTVGGVKQFELWHVPRNWVGTDRFLWGGVYEGERLWDKIPRDIPGFDPGKPLDRLRLTIPFPRVTFEKEAGARMAATAGRPAVKPGDRTGLTPTKPEPPAAWAALPAVPVTPPPAGRVTMPYWPTATNGRHSAAVTFDYVAEPRPQYAVNWRRYDLYTGKEAGPVVRLWPWAEMTERHVTAGLDEFPALPTAVSADGTRLAMRDPADPHRVDVWDASGKRLGGFVPYDRKSQVEWVGWGGDKLLTLGGGRLTGWDGAGGKAVWEVEGGYSRPAAMPPGGAWVAAAAGDAFDLIDAASGRCLGRCAGPAGGDFLSLAVSPDGRGLAAARPGADKVPRGPKASAEFVADIWDLSTGKRESVPFGSRRFAFLTWTDPEHLVAGTTGVELIDRRAGAAVAAFGMTVRGELLHGTRRAVGDQQAFGSPDGRVWASIPEPGQPAGQSERRSYRTVALPDSAEEADKLLFAADREYLRPAAGPVRIEIDLGTEERGRLAAPRVAAGLRERGFTIGPGGYVLRISHAVKDSDDKLRRAGQSDEGTPVPKVEFTWRMYAPDGGLVWESTSERRFLGSSSQYFTKRKDVNLKADMSSTWTDHYDFGGKDIRRAVVAEILDRVADGLPLPKDQPPAAILRTPAGTKTLPLSRTVKVPLGP